MGLSYCPNKSTDRFEIIKDINLFARKVLFKSMYLIQNTKQEAEIVPNLTAAEFRAIRDLNLLLQESDVSWKMDMDDELQNEESSEVVEQPPSKKIKRKFNTFPPLNQNPTLVLFVRQTRREIENMKNDNVTKNWSPIQNLALKSLKNNFGITIKASD